MDSRITRIERRFSGINLVELRLPGVSEPVIVHHLPESSLFHAWPPSLTPDQLHEAKELAIKALWPEKA
jgi:hypothetical protein